MDRLPVEKIELPLDPQGNPQGLGLVLAPNGTLYASQHTIISRSTDGGKTWEHVARDPAHAGAGGLRLQVDQEGRLLNIAQSGPDSPTVWASDDHGENWEQIGRIDIAPFPRAHLGSSVTRLDEGPLLVPITSDEEQVSTGFVWRSHDGAARSPTDRSWVTGAVR